MVKTKLKMAPKAKVARAKPPSGKSGLDSLGAKYAQLILDPCNGPLVHGVPVDADTGLISRFETDVIINNEATSTAAYVAWCPALSLYYLSGGAIPLDSTAFTPTGTSAVGPGGTFLASNASEYRVLAACLQAYYPGSETSRSGIVSNTQDHFARITTSTTVGGQRSSSQFTERTPNTMTEIIWRPAAADLEWNSVANSDTGVNSARDKHAVLISTASGIPVSTGMRYRMVAVVEWKPVFSGTGVSPTTVGSRSKNTLADVLEVLDSHGVWWYKTANAVGRVAATVVKAAGQVAYGAAKFAAAMA
jgi:hypothetical protein